MLAIKSYVISTVIKVFKSCIKSKYIHLDIKLINYSMNFAHQEC